MMDSGLEYEQFYGDVAIDERMTDTKRIDEALENQRKQAMGEEEVVEEKAEEPTYAPQPDTPPFYGLQGTENRGFFSKFNDKLETAVLSIYSPSFKKAYTGALLSGEPKDMAKMSGLKAVVQNAVDKGEFDAGIAEDVSGSLKYYGKSGMDRICDNMIMGVILAPVCFIVGIIKAVLIGIGILIGIILLFVIIRMILRHKRESKKLAMDETDRAERKELIKKVAEAKIAAK